MTINEVKATLRDGIRAIEQGRLTFEQAAVDATEATARAHQLLRGSQAGEVEIVRKLLAEAASEVKPTVARFVTAKNSAQSYLARLG